MTPVGRPEIGTPINVRLGDDLLAKVDAHAQAGGVSRASIIRSLVAAALDELDDETLRWY
jgi:metal-responsive CopG/Arc/MetJ family transcriptional regulator